MGSIENIVPGIESGNQSEEDSEKACDDVNVKVCDDVYGENHNITIKK